MRLDAHIASKYNVTRNKAKQLIEMSLVCINGKIAHKPSFNVSDSDSVTIVKMLNYASMGGEKLAKALHDFNYSVKDKICVDIGSSNGGFTDCLLQNGASKVYAVDIGENAFSPQLKADERIIIKDRTNARYITRDDIGESCDFACIDVSFISLKLILPAVAGLIDKGDIIALIKPQFEVGQTYLSKKGIVLSEKARMMAIEGIRECAKSLSLAESGITTAPVREGKNLEYLILLHKI